MNKLAQIMGIIAGISNTILTVQTTMGSQPGPTKQAMVETQVMQSLEMAEIISGDDIVDEKEFRKGLKNCVKSIVQMLKATRFWKKK